LGITTGGFYGRGRTQGISIFVAIKITNLQQISDQYAIRNFVYSDLHLDLTKKGKYNPEIDSLVESPDFLLDYDEGAIKNSLRNLFNTRPSQRILFPEYGLDLYQLLFEPITETNSRVLGDRIVNAITLYEPRVRVKQCTVEPYPDDQLYDITLILEFPLFNTTQTLNSNLDVKTRGFVFIDTPRNI
jgi:phage baseplate assembly protein W